MEGEVMKVTAERRSLIEKLQQIEVVEDAIRDLYVQMKVCFSSCDACKNHPSLWLASSVLRNCQSV